MVHHRVALSRDATQMEATVMSRPGFALKVDEHTPQLLTLAGDRVRLQRFPIGTEVIYPPQPVASSDPVALVEGALANPVDSASLEKLLRPGMKLTLVVGNVDPVQPRMRFDIRRTILERVLEHAARARVDDVAIVVAGGLGPRWGGQEIVEALGDRVATSFLPEGRIISHDVTAEDLVTVATLSGEPVRVNSRIAESDLVVSVDICHGPREPMSLAVGATDVATINRVCGFAGSDSARREITTAIHGAIPIFSVAAVLGQPYLGRQLSFMNHCEWEWRFPEQVAYATARQFVSLMPRQGTQKLYAAPRADYELCDVIGGAPTQVAARAAEVWRAANTVAAPQTGILLTSVWGSSFDPGDPVGSPVNAVHQALCDAGTDAKHSFLRNDGVLIAFHPLSRIFPNRVLAPAADFFTKVLPVTKEPTEIHERCEPQVLDDDWYVKLYRNHNAWHPLAVFHTWYEICRATSRLADVIWVGADRETTRILGQRAATTLDDALELAWQITGDREPATYLHGPGWIHGEPR